MAMSFYAAEKINLIKEVAGLRLDLPHEFKLSVGATDRGIKFDKMKYEKTKNAICNAILSIPLFGGLAWKFVNNQVKIVPRASTSATQGTNLTSVQTLTQALKEVEAIWTKSHEDRKECERNVPAMPRPPASTSAAAANQKYVEKMTTYLANVSEWDKRKEVFIATERKDHDNVRTARAELERAQLQEQKSDREHREPEYTHERDLLECKNDGTIFFR